MAKAKRDVQQEITDRFIEAIEGNLIEGRWVCPWNKLGAGLPKNVVSGKAYRGMNLLILAMSGRGSNEWATYKQWAEKGAQVRKGEKGTAILAPIIKNVDDAGQTEKRLVGFRGATIFNAEQVDGYTPAPVVEIPEFARLETAEAFITNTGATIGHGGDRAFYMPSQDRIQMPERGQFADASNYYGTIFHELIHWTKEKGRKDRSFGAERFGDNGYAMEELVAEIGASFLCAEFAIHAGFRDDHAKYVKSWLDQMKGDSRAIMTAASHAQAAVDFLLDAAEGNTVEESAAA